MPFRDASLPRMSGTDARRHPRAGRQRAGYWRGALLLAGLIGAGGAARGADLERTEIWFSNGAYRYFFAATLDADADAVRRVVSDFDHMARLNDGIVESRLLERYDARTLKRRLRLEHCLLFFCFDIAFVERVEILPNGDIETTILPDESTFRRGTAVWRIAALEPGRTRVSLEADQAPKFWIPPLIGPLVIKRSFIKEVTETVARIERFANEQFQ
ncbi:MAG: SRPBCC family protein [Gammaproteobacteria bacterium]